MGCNCGGGRQAARAAAAAANGGVPVAWRLYYPQGGTVDYTNPGAASDAMAKVPGSEVKKVDTRTGQVIP